MRGSLRRSVAGVTVLGVLGLAFMPSEHVHSAATTDGRHADVVHRHFEGYHSHHPSGSDVRVGHHADEEDARWLDLLYVAPQASSDLIRVDDVVLEAVALPQLPLVSRWIRPATYVSVHDPPWATVLGLRAPPFLLV